MPAPCVVLAAFLTKIAAAFLLLLTHAAAAAPIDDASRADVTIAAGDAVLSGTLYRPAGAKGDIPGVVVGHGSGKVTRQNTFWTNVALSAGFAALMYDKRGAGASTGTFPEWELETTGAMFQQLAGDMVHAVRLLATQKGIDRDRIGLMGGSQAGWIMPLAASQEPLVKFVIIGEGVPLPAGIEEVHSGYLDLVGNENNPTLAQVTGADATALSYAGPLGYDPAPVLERLTTPVLWIFGYYDGVIPVRQSIDRIGQLQKAGKRNHALHIFPFGDHNFQNVFTGESYDVAEASRNWFRTTGLADREHLQALRNGTSEEHARIAWTKEALQAKLSPPNVPPSWLQQLAGRYAGGRAATVRSGRLFYRVGDNPERELVPIGKDLFALDTVDSPVRVKFNRRDGKVASITFLRVSGPYQENAREGD